MKKTKVASRRINRVCPICELSNRTRHADRTAAGREYPDSHMVKNTVGTVSAPISAGMARNARYGTLLSMYESPMLSKRKWPS